MSSLLFQASTILLILFFSLSPLASPATAIVLDNDGDILLTSSSYYITPVFRGRGGGLTLSSKNNSEPCPLYVIQDNNEVSLGDPVRFYPINSKQGFVSSSSNLNIDFGLFNICGQSTVWRLTPDEPTGRLYVGVGGTIWDWDAISDWFKIEKDDKGEYDYKIVFCPMELSGGGGGGGEVVCGNVGVFIEGGKRVLGLSDEPLLVNFKKA